MKSDAELVSEAKKGSKDAFEQLIFRYERSILAVTTSQLKDIHQAEDASQASFLLAFRKLATLQDDSLFSSWLMKIAKRQAIEIMRKNRQLVPVKASNEINPEEISSVQQDKNDQNHLLDLISQLPEHERVLINLHYFDGHDTKAISKITGRPLGTVTKQLSRGRKRLESLLRKEGQR